EQLVARAAAAGLASVVHAIGDAAVSLALDVLGRAPRSGLAMPHRIEHVQCCAPDRLADAGRSGIVCSVQPSHLLSDWQAADRHWGARARHAYAFRSLAAGGATLAFGSDAPVEPVDPRLSLFAAVTRQDTEGKPVGGWYPEERIDVSDALVAFTRGPAIAAGMDRELGRLEPGTLGDIAVWDRDPLAVPASELPAMRCTATIVGGQLVWRDA
ncbi:MAG TPA: amidohydrolase family protein, partial [Longimicrobiales bacterium]|nr:amidohydrolase family protein [Longimicrobiales bacterium]